MRLRIPLGLSAALLLGFIFISLQLMSAAIQGESQLSDMYTWLILGNSIGAGLLLILVVFNIGSLVVRLKRREAGSRLTTRIVLLFIMLSLLPAGVVFYYSVQFLHRSIDSWFNVELEGAMEDALELSHAALEGRMRWSLKHSQRLTVRLQHKSSTEISLELEALRSRADANEATLLFKNGDIIAFSGLMPSDILPSLPVTALFLQVQQNEDYVSLASVNDALVVQTIVAISAQPGYYLQIIYPIPERINDLADSVEFAYVRFQEMNYLRHSLKRSFSLVLLLVLLMSLLASIWIAFMSVKEIIMPIRDLVRGTQAVAAGVYEQLLPVKRQDDLGFLVESFNNMAHQITRARDDARRSAQETECERAYLETLLTSITSGVLSFDADLTIRTANQAASIILHVKVMRYYGQNLRSMAKGRADLIALVDIVQPLLEKPLEIWQRSISVEGSEGRKEILCHGASLFSEQGHYIGAVLVFDDITSVVQAQKEAAWSEVARRLAHEIKNPLTPIQLSAERLQHKLLGQLDGNYAEILTRLTGTIVQQVEAMKLMVNDFSEYARPVDYHKIPLDLLVFIKEIIVLYSSEPEVIFHINAAAYEDFIIDANEVSIRQVVHNIVKNSLEAMGHQGEIFIELSLLSKNSAQWVQLVIFDTGCGIDEQHVHSVFEPYVTNKPKGTGLGLAIVKKIVEEHGGLIWLDTQCKKGARFVLQFPRTSYLSKELPEQ